MEIVPVIDLRESRIVRGIAGKRSEYLPLRSELVPEATPAALARIFREEFAFRSIYIADLDAIAGLPPNFSLYQPFATAQFSIWLDAGVGSVQQANHLLHQLQANQIPAQLVIGLESLTAIAELERLVATFGAERLIFSLDLRAGQPLMPRLAAGISPVEIAELALAAGFEQIILLDVVNVGTANGIGTWPLLRWLRLRAPQLKLITGGGISNAADLTALAEAGCSAVLVASALHDRRILPFHLQQFKR